MSDQRRKSHPGAYDEEYYRSHHSGLFEKDLDTIPSFIWIKRFLDLRPGERVLDAGSGIGYLLDYIHLPGTAGVGVDFSTAALRQAAGRFTRLHFVNANLLSMAFKSETFDRILCFNVIEHLRRQDALMRELYRVLKKNGTLVIGTNMKYAPCNLIYKLLVRDHTHEKELTVSRFSRLVGRYFTVKKARKSSCVTRFSEPVNRLFHRFLKADILIQAKK